MAYCGKCGNKLVEGDKFCQVCGTPTATSGPSKEKIEAQPTQPMATQPVSPPPATKRYSVAMWLIPLILIFLFLGFSFFSFIVLSLVGAQGQPATVIPPASKASTNGNSVPIPKQLAAASAKKEIFLRWQGGSGPSVETYRIYRSFEPGKKYALSGKVTANSNSYSDKDVKKGVAYYYVVTAVTDDGAESGNSKEAAAVIDAPPLVPQGIYSWADVKKRAEADPKYLTLLTKVTGLTTIDISRLVQKEKSGTVLKKTLLKGTVITNTTKNYKILPNFILKTNRIALTDESGRPYILTKCGNPMKLQISITPTSIFIQNVQIFVTNVIMIFPPSITNVFINAGQPANTIMVAVLPASIRTIFGPTFAPPPPGTFIDPADLGDDYAHAPEKEEVSEEEPGDGEEPEEQVPEHPEEETPTPEPTPEPEPALPPGQQWVEEGRLLVIAEPSDPAPNQSVRMTVRLIPAEPGVEISYEVRGTDDYTASGTLATDDSGEISFSIPGGALGVRDTISVNVPSENLEGSVEYQF